MIRLLPLPAAFSIGFFLAACVLVPNAYADPISIAASATPFDTAGFARLRLTDAALGNTTPFSFGNDQVSFAGLGAEEGIVRGASPGNYAPPVMNTADDLFTGKYLAVGNTGFINIAFTKPQQSLSLLWGSVDSSNQITLLDDNQVVGVVDGADIDANADGSQDVDGSFYVMLSSAVKFDSIEISSGVQSFELAEFRSDAEEIPIHEPASFTLLGAGLLGLVGLRRRS